MVPERPRPFSERSGAVEVRKSQKFLKMFADQNLSSVEKYFVGDRLKRIVLNFQPDRSYPRGVNDLPKYLENPKSDIRMVIDGCFLGVFG